MIDPIDSRPIKAGVATLRTGRLRLSLGEAIPRNGRPRPTARLKILSRWARLARARISLAALSALGTSQLITDLFGGALFRLRVAVVIVALFLPSMGSLISSMVFFNLENNFSLKAHWLEIPSEARRAG